MNCKQGEWAWIVFCPVGTEHLLGRMVKLTTRGPDSPQYQRYPNMDTRPTWRYEGPLLHGVLGSPIDYINDCCLSPIRPSEGADETLSWKEVPAGKPQEIEA